MARPVARGGPATRLQVQPEWREMRAVSSPRFHRGPSWPVIIALAAVVVLSVVLLVFAGGMSGSGLDPVPDGQFLGPFRWLPEGGHPATV